MKKKLLAAALVLSLVFPVCACSIGAPTCGFITRTIKVKYVDDSFNTNATVRYYGDDVPYMSVENYLALLFRGTAHPDGRESVTVEKSGDEYVVTPVTGVSGVFDVDKNTFYTENFSMFKNVNTFETGIEGCVSYDSMPWIKVESVTVDKPAEPMFIDFDDYDIDVYGDEKSVYLPLTVLGYMYSCMNLIDTIYDRNSLYIFYELDLQTSDDFGPFYKYAFSKNCSSGYARFNYNAFCLDYDYFLGRSGRSSLERYYDLSKGLDAALDADEYGRTIKRYLKSTNNAERFAGMRLFDCLFEDGGHSYYDVSLSAYYKDEDGNNVSYGWFNNIKDEFEGIANSTEKNDAYEDRAPRYFHHGEIYDARNTVLGKEERALSGTETYTKVGDTAIIHIDAFNEYTLTDKWFDYYNGVTDELPFGDGFGGPVCAAYCGLKRAEEDGVKRVIFDLTANVGGSTDDGMYVISLLTGISTACFYDRTTGQKYTVNYKIDRNLDRVFDESDDLFDLVGDKKITVLLSGTAFSCGNFVPIMLHEGGVYVVGDNSGGGSCAIYKQHDAFGSLINTSCPVQLLTLGGVDCDTARLTVCDTFLPQTELEGGKIDFTAFFDVENLNSLIDAHYA